jgi:hypothetical protein
MPTTPPLRAVPFRWHSAGHATRAACLLTASLLAASLLAACGKDAATGTDTTSPTTGSTPSPTAIRIVVATDSQRGMVAVPLAKPLVARVDDQNGKPYAGATVNWAVLTGNGTVSLASATTDVNGEATTVWTLGKGVGAQLLRAALPSGTADTAVATGTAGAAAIMAAIDGLAQEVRAGAVSEPLVVQVQDRYGNGVPGVSVAWSTDAGTLSAASGTTESRGLASVRLTTAAAPRAHVVTARVTGVGTLTFGVTGR